MGTRETGLCQMQTYHNFHFMRRSKLLLTVLTIAIYIFFSFFWEGIWSIFWHGKGKYKSLLILSPCSIFGLHFLFAFTWVCQLILSYSWVEQYLLLSQKHQKWRRHNSRTISIQRLEWIGLNQLEPFTNGLLELFVLI